VKSRNRNEKARFGIFFFKDSKIQGFKNSKIQGCCKQQRRHKGNALPPFAGTDGCLDNGRTAIP
jgi:hypothetical protein